MVRIGALALRATVALALVAGAPREAPAQLEAGVGVAPLPAPVGAALAGYGGLRDRIATGTLDPPEARAIVFASPDRRVALMALDLVIVTAAIREAVAARTGPLEIDTLLIAATHTHSGPGGYLPGWLAERVTAGRYDPAMPARIAEAAALALERAASDLLPARVGAAQGRLDLARNRRVEDGGDETALPVVRVDRLDGTPVATLFAYGCHAVVLSRRNREYSADYVGAARAELDGSLGTALYLPGPLGDQNPASAYGELWPDDPLAMRAQLAEIGARVAAAVRDVREGIEANARGPLRAVERWVESPPLQTRRFSSLWWFAPLTRRPLERFLSDRAVFQAVRVGNALFVGFPSEISSALGDAARSDVPEGLVAIPLAHANDWLGYSVSRDAYRRGGYEASLSFFGEGFGPWLLDQAAATLKRLAEPAPRRIADPESG